MLHVIASATFYSTDSVSFENDTLDNWSYLTSP